jgi:hypothetical protein
MDNQHRKITGYRELSEGEIGLINDIKRHGEMLGDLCGMLEALNTADIRWVAIGKTHLQQGIMALVRAVARPETF